VAQKEACQYIQKHITLAGQHAKTFCLKIIYYLYKILPMQPTLLNLDAAFSALADPTRRAILARLAQGEATVMELAEPFEITQPAISQHLKVLEEAGLIARRVDGTKRPRRLVEAGIEAMDQWLAMMRKALTKNYDRLDDILAAMEPEKGKETR
jgi:DNA-binding transcriptional ArsR family regulator